jgi:hypothetical protein
VAYAKTECFKELFMKKLIKSKLSITLLCGLVLSVSACNQNNATDDLSDDDLQDLGSTVISETENAASSTSISDAITGVGFSIPISELQTRSVKARALPAGCLSTVGSTTDSDSDGVPDSITYIFDEAKCTQNVPLARGGGTQTLGGQIKLEDTSPNISDRSYRQTLSALKYVRDPALKPKFVETRDGVREVTQAGNTSLTKTHNITLVRQVAFRAKVTLVNKMAFAYQVSGAGTIDLNQPLPAGTFTLTGSNEFTVGNKFSRVFTTSTQAALVYNPSCDSQRIVGGELRLTTPKTEIKIVFQACGTEPVVSRVF